MIKISAFPVLEFSNMCSLSFVPIYTQYDAQQVPVDYHNN